jgi:ABC-2 type transport system permease protein
VTAPALRVAGRDLRVSARLLVLSMLCLLLLGYLMAWGYPAFLEKMAVMGKHVPRFMRRAMEAKAGGVSFETYVGFAFFHPVTIAIMGIWPITRAVRAVAGDLERGALGWMLAYPIGRVPFLLARAGVMVAGVAVLQATLLVALRAWGTWFHVALAPWSHYALAALNGFLLYAAVGAMVLWASAASTRAATPAFFGAGLVLVSLVLEYTNGMVELLEAWRWLSLFHYYDAQSILKGAAISAHDAAVLGGLLVAGIAGAAITFARRDLPI